MNDLRCMVGLHNYVQPPRGTRVDQPVLPGRLAVQCSRCLKGKTIQMHKDASGPMDFDGMLKGRFDRSPG